MSSIELPEGEAIHTTKSRRAHRPPPGCRRTTFDLTVPLRKALVLAAAQEDRPMVSIVEEALTLWMRLHEYDVEDYTGRGSAPDRAQAHRR